MYTYSKDMLYNVAGGKAVKTGWLDKTEGTQGDETWVFIPDKGLFHAKKHNGEWYYEKYLPKTEDDTSVIESVIGSTTVNNVSITDGVLDTLIVNDETTLSTTTTITGALTVQNITNGLIFPHNSANLKDTGNQLDTFQGIGYSGKVGFGSLVLGNNAENTTPGTNSGIMACEYIAYKGASTYDSHGIAGFINKVVGMYDDTTVTDHTGSDTYGGTQQATLPLTDANGAPLQMKLFARNQIASLQTMPKTSSTYVSETQWGYINAMDQPVNKDVDIEFNTITLIDAAPYVKLYDTDSNAIWNIGMADDDLVFTAVAGTTPQLDFNRHTVTSKNSEFVSNLDPSGRGWRISASVDSAAARYTLEIDNLYLRGTLDVAELVIHQIRATNGSLMLSSAGRLIGLLITDVSNRDLANDSGGYVIATATFESEDSDYMPFVDDDLLWARKIQPDGETLIMEQYMTVYSTTNDTAVLHLSTENQYNHGIVWAAVVNGDTLAESELSALQDVGVVRIGNTDNDARQGTIFMTTDDLNSPYIDVRDPVTSYATWAGSTVVRMGNLDGIGSVSGYGLYGENVELTGKITATSGAIAGWSLVGNIISSGSVAFNSAAELLKIGDVTNFTANSTAGGSGTAEGILIGKHSGNDGYDFFVGKEDGEHIWWDNENEGGHLNVKGIIHLQEGSTGVPSVSTPDTFRFKCVANGVSHLYNANDVSQHNSSAHSHIRIVKWVPATHSWSNVGLYDVLDTLDTQNNFGTLWNLAVSNEDLIAIFGAANVLVEGSGGVNSEFVDKMFRIGITTAQMALCYGSDRSPVLIIGKQKATSHSGASFQLGTYEDDTFFETEVSGFENTMTLVSTTGHVDDVDAFVAPKWEYSSEAGYNWKPDSTGGNERTVKAFVFPQVHADDVENIFLKVTGTNLANGGTGTTTKMFINGTEVAITGFSAGRDTQTFKPNSTVWNTAVGENNSVTFRVASSQNHTLTESVNLIAVWQLGYGVYSGIPADPTPTAKGLYMTDTRVGFHSGTAWTSYIGTAGDDATGVFSFGNGGTDNISYSTATGLVLKGKMTAGSIESVDTDSNNNPTTVFNLDDGRLTVNDSTGQERVRLGLL